MPLEVEIIEDKIPGLVSRVLRNTEEMVYWAVHEIETIAKGIVPVDTGALQASIEGTAAGMEGHVVVGEYYAGYVEFGTRYMPAQPYLQPAVDEVAPEFEARTGMLIEVSWL